MGRLTRDPEVRYSQSANPVAVARYGLAVRRSFVKPGEPDVDFFNIVAFGKAGEFAEKYLRQGTKVAVTGRIQTGSYTNKDGYHYFFDRITINETYFSTKYSDKFEMQKGISMDIFVFDKTSDKKFLLILMLVLTTNNIYFLLSNSIKIWH